MVPDWSTVLGSFLASLGIPPSTCPVCACPCLVSTCLPAKHTLLSLLLMSVKPSPPICSALAMVRCQLPWYPPSTHSQSTTVTLTPSFLLLGELLRCIGVKVTQPDGTPAELAFSLHCISSLLPSRLRGRSACCPSRPPVLCCCTAPCLE